MYVESLAILAGWLSATSAMPAPLVEIVLPSSTPSGLSPSLPSSAAPQSNAASLPSGWYASGCWTDNVPERVLSGARYSDSGAMTSQACIAFCNGHGYSVAGTEYSSECFCGYALSRNSTLQAPSACHMACSGDPSQTCGDSNLLNVFTNGAGAPTNHPGPTGWVALGCYTDDVSARSLVNSPSPERQVPADSMSVEACTAACRGSGYPYAGVEYGSECYCGFEIKNGGAPARNADDCNMACRGQADELCGGPARLNMYRLADPTEANATGPMREDPSTLPNGWAALGCWNDNVSGGRALQYGLQVPGGASNMTVEGCLATCRGAGYSLAGLEYAQECWCANQVTYGGYCANDQTTCSLPCKGNMAEMCGGPNLLNMYQYVPDTSVRTLAACPGYSGSSNSGNVGSGGSGGSGNGGSGVGGSGTGGSGTGGSGTGGSGTGGSGTGGSGTGGSGVGGSGAGGSGTGGSGTGGSGTGGSGTGGSGTGGSGSGGSGTGGSGTGGSGVGGSGTGGSGSGGSGIGGSGTGGSGTGGSGTGGSGTGGSGTGGTGTGGSGTGGSGTGGSGTGGSGTGGSGTGGSGTGGSGTGGTGTGGTGTGGTGTGGTGTGGTGAGGSGSDPSLSPTIALTTSRSSFNGPVIVPTTSISVPTTLALTSTSVFGATTSKSTQVVTVTAGVLTTTVTSVVVIPPVATPFTSAKTSSSPSDTYSAPINTPSLSTSTSTSVRPASTYSNPAVPPYTPSSSTSTSTSLVSVSTYSNPAVPPYTPSTSIKTTTLVSTSSALVNSPLSTYTAPPAPVETPSTSAKASSSSISTSSTPAGLSPTTTSVSTSSRAASTSSTSLAPVVPSTSSVSTTTTSTSAAVVSSSSTSVFVPPVPTSSTTSVKPVVSSSTFATSAVSTPSSTSNSGSNSCAWANMAPADYGIVSNGGFESGASPWSISTPSNRVSADTSNNGKAYSGCGALTLTPNSYNIFSAPSVTITQPLIGLQPDHSMIFSMVVGRMSSSMVLNAPVITGNIGGIPFGPVPVCNGLTCLLSGSGGAVYDRFTFPFVYLHVLQPNAALTLTVTWPGVFSTAPVLIDEITLRQDLPF